MTDKLNSEPVDSMMNANYLATALHGRVETNRLYSDQNLLAATMLRQQQAEIEAPGCAIWKTPEEFNQYKKIILATVEFLRKASEK
ncbi:hypothetical protein ICN48_05505 [Polynucleobacter sp. JS-Safj-400b-B2]|uniref:hypothetical protein n=1 Tax=Polynucleobacter sp. JS-Safj-400b-B2 TaxID=2576921 RepID=UPI001C0B45AF|nr:hypothetical protein [Polynucleobacter sp. JS-Safj-400b-B2]MBU3625690.1 hypothetical protein [Polynucleobacter sp. JS-Safj-400b-B2]